MKPYDAPVIREHGSLTALTQQSFNKIGHSPDVFTNLTNGAVIGSLVGAP